ERQTRFIELWTLKEAYLKATGAGLTSSLSDFGFDLRTVDGLAFNAPPAVSGADWQFALFAPTARHRMAVAVRAAGPVDFTAGAWPSGTQMRLPAYRPTTRGAPDSLDRLDVNTSARIPSARHSWSPRNLSPQRSGIPGRRGGGFVRHSLPAG